MKSKIIAHILLLLAGFLFGANYWIAKGLMPVHMQPLPIMFFRVSGALLLFYILSFFGPREKIERKDMKRLVLAGLTGIAINQIMFFTGLNLTSPVDTSIIHASSPVLVVAFAAIMIKEKIRFQKIIGILMGAGGAIYLILSAAYQQGGQGSVKGNIIIFINISAYSIYLVLIKPMMSKYHAFTVMKWVFVFGFVFVFPLTVWTLPSIEWTTIPRNIWLSLLYVVVCTTFLTYLMTTHALKSLSAGTVGYYIYLQPLIASAIGYYLGKEILSLEKVLAALLIFWGVFLVEFRFTKGAGKGL